jgi:DNA-binding transcriptional LysR family regulator
VARIASEIDAAALAPRAAIVRKVAELGSTSRAARVLGLSLQSVSVAVRSIEQDSGVRVLTRDGAVLRATAAGAAYLASVLGVPQATSPVPKPELIVDVCVAELRALVLPALPCFTACHATTRLQIRSSTAMLEPWPQELAAAVRTGAEWLARAHATEIAAYPQALCAAKPYLARHGVPRQAQDLASHVFVRSLRQGDAALEPLPFGVESAADSPGGGTLTLAMADADARLAAVLAGRGIAVLPLNPTVRAHLARGGLAQLLPQLVLPPYPVVLLSATQPPPALEAFAQWLRSLYASETHRAGELREPGAAEAADR